MAQTRSTTRSPIAIFAFNRSDTLRKCLDALEKCEEFRERSVFIFCDGPRPSVADDRDSVADVLDCSRKWARKTGAVVRASEENLGLRRSITAGVSSLLAIHNSIIVLEDDIVVSKFFLQFMDQALTAFEHVDNVWQISGWFPPTRANLTSGFLRVPGCWGWGTWRRAWSAYSDDAENLASRISGDDLIRFNLDGVYDYANALSRNANGLQNTWHVRWYASMFLNQALALYPGVSLTRNIGFDQRGTNCTLDRTSRVLVKQTLAKRFPSIPDTKIPPEETTLLFQEMRSFLNWQTSEWSRPSLMTRLRHRLRRVLGR